MVPFAGYSLPVQYPDGVLKSHLHTREAGKASLFDVGHMGQLVWTGRDRAAFLESVCVADVRGLPVGASALTLLTNDAGGIIDDSIITNRGDSVYMVVNGATKHGDMAHFDERLKAFRAAGRDAGYAYLAAQNLVALQGPASADVLAGVAARGPGGAAAAAAVRALAFMTGLPSVELLPGARCSVTRCGYTGEDGFEVGMEPAHAVAVARALLADARVAPAALGARDSLRLEAGLCLYGHDIDATTTPAEAVLGWTVAKARREAGRDNFPGAARVLGELKSKSAAKKRVGLRVLGAPAREGARIYARPAPGAPDATAAAPGGPIGVVTSGTFSPTLKAPIAMGYVPPADGADGRELAVDVRGKLVPAVVTKLPFVPHRYHKV